MNDYFALFGEERLPYLDAEVLKTRFLELSGSDHPDRVHNASAGEKQQANERYAAFNEAYNILREPRDRLLHILELELGARPKDVQRIPPGTMDLFVEIGQLCRDVDQFLKERSNTTSPLMKVQAFRTGMEWTDKLQRLQQDISRRRDVLMEELKALNEIWQKAPPAGAPGRSDTLPLERLEQIYRVLSYIARWTEQIQERIVQLAMM